MAIDEPTRAERMQAVDDAHSAAFELLHKVGTPAGALLAAAEVVVWVELQMGRDETQAILAKTLEVLRPELALRFPR